MSPLLDSMTSSVTASLLVSLIASFVGYVLFTSLSYEFSPKAPPPVNEGWPVLGAMRFFTARWDFFRHGRDQSATGNFSFNIGQHPVVALNGDKGRKLFLENRDLGFAEGCVVFPSARCSWGWLILKAMLSCLGNRQAIPKGRVWQKKTSSVDRGASSNEK